jgi:hypothetical protein
MPLKENSPDPMNDVLSAAGFRAAGAAYRLGVFETLREGPLTAAQTAQRLRSDERGIQLLLDTLEVFGYVTREDGRYANSAMSAEWLLPGDSGSFGPAFDFWSTIVFQLWADLEQSIREGQPPLDFYQWLEQHPDTRQNFQTVMRTIARAAAPEVVATVELTAPTGRLLDIGGSHAEYSLAFCRRYPELSATVFDLPGALHAATGNVAPRITLQPGNFLTDDLGTGYDTALLMSVVHGHLPETNITLLRKVAAALNPSGQLLILEQLADPAATEAPNAFNRIFSLNLFHLQGGQTYPYEEITRWLTTAGFTNPQRFDLKESPGDSVLMARKG